MSKKIFLSNGGFTLVSDEDYIFLVCYAWHQDKDSRVSGRIDGKMQLMSRIIAKKMELDLSNMIDHRDRNTLNNCRNNLRSATHGQNNANSQTRVTSKSEIKGVVYMNNNRWRAQIGVGGKTIYLGTFDTSGEAHQAYCKAAIKHYGEFANFG